MISTVGGGGGERGARELKGGGACGKPYQERQREHSRGQTLQSLQRERAFKKTKRG
jgi:hypothetical protein